MNARSWVLCAGCLALAILAAGCASGSGGVGIAAPSEPMIDNAEAKAVAIQAVTHMFLQTNMEEMAKLVDPSCAANNLGPGHGKDMIAGLTREFEGMQKRSGIAALGEAISVREIRFFTKNDIPALKKRFDLKQDLWSERQAPAYMEGALGCYVMAKELRNTKEIDTEIYVFVIKNIAGKHKIVFYGNS